MCAVDLDWQAGADATTSQIASTDFAPTDGPMHELRAHSREADALGSGSYGIAHCQHLEQGHCNRDMDV